MPQNKCDGSRCFSVGLLRLSAKVIPTTSIRRSVYGTTLCIKYTQQVAGGRTKQTNKQ